MASKEIIAFYLRLSVSDGDLGKDKKDESNSIENQRLLLQTFVDSRDDIAGPIQEYVDDGYTGTNFDRPAFKRLIEDAKAGKIKMILVKDLSRLGRDYIGVGDYLEQIFPVLNIRFIAVNSNYDSERYIGKTMGLEMSITNLVNSLYSKDASKKQRTARETKWKKGISTAGRPPFGYIRDKSSKGGLRIDPDSAAYVRKIFMLAIEGKNTTAIADYLNCHHIPTPGQYWLSVHKKEIGCRKVCDDEWMWDSRKVWVILNNLTYTGAMVHGKTIGLHVSSKSRRKVPKNRWFIVENVHEAIVSKDEYEDAQAALTKNNMQASKLCDSGFSLKGKVICGNCRLHMAYEYGITPTIYCAHAAMSGSMSKCDRTRHEAKRIEGIVFYMLRHQIQNLLNLIPAIQKKKEDHEQNLEVQIKSLNRELETWKAERVRQYEAYAGGVIKQEEYQKKKMETASRIAALEEHREQLSAILYAGSSILHEAQSVEDRNRKVLLAEEMTRELAETFIDTVYIYGKEQIEVKFLFDDLIRRAVQFLQTDFLN